MQGNSNVSSNLNFVLLPKTKIILRALLTLSTGIRNNWNIRSRSCPYFYISTGSKKNKKLGTDSSYFIACVSVCNL
ncbi:hypothetical protein MmazTMA_22600 [Methanosarcina mazei]|nr:hypothetical protein MmazTMA_22600 [Methanosarcina mazei]